MPLVSTSAWVRGHFNRLPFLRYCSGGRGIPKGRIVEIFGPESSGKTTLTLHVVAQAQKNGGIAAFIDAEHASIRAGQGCLASI